MSPYYQDEQVTLYLADSMDVMREMDAASVQVVITDLPYSSNTHQHAMSTEGTGLPHQAIEFDSMTQDECSAALSECGRVTSGWVIATLEWHYAAAFDKEPPAGLRSLRVGVWVKTSTTPQISGDRPAMGWEAISYLHRSDKAPKWNGGGKAGNFILNAERKQGHPTAKPMALAGRFIDWFSAPGDTVFDPFAGSGTTLIAAKQAGRRAIGVEINEAYCELAVSRLAQGTLFGVGEVG